MSKNHVYGTYPPPKRSNLQGIVVIGIGFALLLAVLFLTRLGESAQTTPTPTLNPILSSYIQDAQNITTHPIPAVAEAGQMFVKLLQGQEIAIPDCNGVRVYGRAGLSKTTENVILSVIPDQASVYNGTMAVLVETMGINPDYWQRIPASDRWSFIWHEYQHIKQDCQILLSLTKAKVRSDLIGDEFHQRWVATGAANEAYPLAVQAYWQQHEHGVSVFPALITLMSAQPGAWSNTLTIGADGVPEKIQQQPEWPAWMKLVKDKYLISK